MTENEIRISENKMWREWITVRGTEPISLKDVDDRINELQKLVNVEPVVKPACEIDKENIKHTCHYGKPIKYMVSFDI